MRKLKSQTPPRLKDSMKEKRLTTLDLKDLSKNMIMPTEWPDLLCSNIWQLRIPHIEETWHNYLKVMKSLTMFAEKLSSKANIVEPKPKPAQIAFCLQNRFGTNVYPHKITFPQCAGGKHIPQNLQGIWSCFQASLWQKQKTGKIWEPCQQRCQKAL